MYKTYHTMQFSTTPILDATLHPSKCLRTDSISSAMGADVLPTTSSLLLDEQPPTRCVQEFILEGEEQMHTHVYMQ